MKERTESGLGLVTFGPVKIVSLAGRRRNRLAWVCAAFAVAWIWGSRPCDGQIEVEAYIPNFGSNNVSVIDTNTNTVVGSPIPVGINPIGVALTPDGRFVYVTNVSSNTISVIDHATNTVVGSPIPIGASPVAIAVTPDGGFAYVANANSNTVSVINTATNTVVGSPIPVGAHPIGIAITPDSRFAYVTNQISNTVSVINTATNTVVGSPIPVQSQPSEINVTPDGRFVYVTNDGTNTVSVINTAINTVVGTITVGVAPNAMAITPNGNFAYVQNSASGTVSVINTTTNTVVASIPVPIRASAGGIAITPNGSFAYVTNFSVNTVTVIDTATNTVVGLPIPVGTNPFAEGSFVGPNIIVAAGGPLSIANDAALTPLGFGQFVDFNGGTLRTTGSLVTTRTISLLAQGGTIDTNGFNSILSGNIINSGSLTKFGAGTLTLSGANSYTGGTNLIGGILAVNSDGNLGTGVLSFNGGTLEALGAGGGITSAKAVTLNAGGGTFLADTSTSSTLSGTISGIGALSKSGSGTLVLTGVNTYSGGTSFNGGIVAVNSDGNLGTGTLSFNGGILGALAAGGGITSSKAVTLDAGGGTFLADTGTSSTLSGTISGTGSLTKNGPGTLTLSGNNTYGGATNVAAGTLRAGSSTALSASSAFTVNSVLDLNGFSNSIGSLSGTGTVTNNGAAPAVLTVGNDNTNTTFGGILKDGTSLLGLTKIGTGTLTLTGANTYSNGTTISAGTLQVGNAGMTGSIIGNVTDNGALAFNRSDTVTFGNVISGTGALVQAGGGTLILTGNNTYSGGTTINTGTLQIGNGGTIGDIIGNVTDNGTLAFDRSGAKKTFGGVISGSGSLIKLGSDILELTADNTYSGGITIEDGILVAGVPTAGQATSFALGKGDVFLQAGTLRAPSLDPLVINVGGNYTQASGGTLALGVAGINGADYDHVQVGANASLNGTLAVSSSNNFHPVAGNVFGVLETGGSRSGQFATVNDFLNNNPSLQRIDVYAPNGVALVYVTAVTPAPPPNPRPPVNIVVRTPLPPVEPEAPLALSFLFAALDPTAEQLTSMFEIGFSGANTQRFKLDERFDEIQRGSTGFVSNLPPAPTPVTTGKEVAPKQPVAPPPPPENRWGVWANGWGDWVTVDNDGFAKGYNFTTGGFIIGVDYRLTDHFAVGLMGSYAYTRTNLQPAGDIDINTGRGGLYLTYFSNGFYINAVTYGGHNSYNTSRQGLLGSANGSTSSGELSTWTEAGYDFHLGNFTVGPMGALQYSLVHVDGFSEQGSLLPLHIHSNQEASLRTDLGARATYTWHLGKVLVIPTLTVAWEHEYLYSDLPITVSSAEFPGSATFSGPSEGHDNAIVNAGAACQFTPRLSTYLGYQGQLGRGNYNANAVTGGFSFSF